MPRRVSDTEFWSDICDDRLGRDPAGPEDRDFTLADLDWITIIRIVDIGDTDQRRITQVYRSTMN